MQVVNGEMKVRIGEVSLAVVIGIVTWWCWGPSVIGLRLGLCAYGILLLCCRYRRPARMMVWIATFMLGALRLSTMTNATDQSIESNDYTTGWVVKSNRRQALIQNSERWMVDFFPSAPKQGSLVSVWHQQPSLDWFIGMVVSIPLDELGHKEWEVKKNGLSTVSPNVFKSQSYLEQLTYGGVLWALMSGDKSGVDPELKHNFNGRVPAICLRLAECTLD